MADWKFTTHHRLASPTMYIVRSTPAFGDAMSAEHPTDQLRTINWVVKGLVKLYAADMTFLGDYGAGEKMLVPQPSTAFGKTILVAASDDVDYYCLGGTPNGYWTGDIITLAPNETRVFNDVKGKSIFVTDGALTDKAKHTLLKFEVADEITLTAGDKGAMLVLFWKLP